MIASEDPFTKAFLNIAFGVFLICGLLGAALVSDEFDAEKAFLFGLVGIPLATLFYFFSWLYPQWPRRFVITYRVMILTLFLIYLTGNLTLLNAIGGSPENVQHRTTILSEEFIAMKKVGAFGYLYKYRF